MVVHGNPARRFSQGDPRFRVEVLDDDVLLLDVQTSIVHRVPGGEVDRLLSGVLTYQTGHLPSGGAEAIRRALSNGSLQRRSVLVGGGALVASGILSTGLPFAAAAMSDFPSPFDSSVYTEGWNAQTASTVAGDDWPLGGEWDSARRKFTLPANVTEVQVVLHATSGTRDQEGVGDGPALSETYETGSGHGAYIVATIEGLAVFSAPRDLYFTLRAGGRGGGNANGNQRGGYGGIAVGVHLWDGGGTPTWFAVAGAGGGDGGSGANPGGRWALPGGGDLGGSAPSGTTGGLGGSAGAASSSTAGTVGYDANTASGDLGRAVTSTAWGAGGSQAGGGGGAGWASGGGGGGDTTETGGGGAGGSSFINPSTTGPRVTSHSIYTVPRAYKRDGSTVRIEVYTPSGA